MPVHYENNFELDKASERYYSYLDLIKSKWRLRNRKIDSGKSVIVYKNVQFKLADVSHIIIGDHSMFLPYVVVQLTKPQPSLHIGKHVGIGRFTHILVKNKIQIGDYTRIGAFTTIRDHIHAPFKSKDEKIIQTESLIEPVIIGKDVWIGNYATIFPGVTIGDGAVISTYALVTEDVAPYTVVVGQPARAVKMRYK